ncbi:MAG TPA: outer membrane lipid asymmetry maintenance protein MlaD [Gallionellaceae bacterium]|nr:outer membrane lipid asymmetry maintenance protein MlaD [Gallionellaceae bacterium]
MERTTLDLWVGAFVIAGIVALTVLAFKVGNLSTYNMSQTYELQAYFNNIGGLKPDAAVRSAGVLVGRVKSISLDTQTYQAKVTMTIDKRYQFDTDTYAKVLTSGLLGEQYIGLSVGGSDEMFKPGDTIKHTESAMVLEDLIGKVINMMAEGSAKPKPAQ